MLAFVTAVTPLNSVGMDDIGCRVFDCTAKKASEPSPKCGSQNLCSRMRSNPLSQPFPSEGDRAADGAAVCLSRGCPLTPALSPSEGERESGGAVGSAMAST